VLYAVVVMSGRSQPAYERIVGEFEREEDAAAWCAAEGIEVSADGPSGARWGVIVPLERLRHA
jgi:hypothetical protein